MADLDIKYFRKDNSTHVHTVDGGVAFGVERGNTDYHMHGNDEFITEEELLKDAVLFACAIGDICG